MKYIKLRIALYVASTWLIEVSSLLFNAHPDIFARERYTRSRNKTEARSINLVSDDAQVLDFVAVVNQYGYPGEEHLVTTIDGYRLRIHRIPGSPSSPKGKKKQIVYFQHGLLASSDSWVLMGPDHDFAYSLADRGYDIWIGNMRGNTYSRSHTTLSPNYDPQFWQYSFHEGAIFDVSAIIDYILNETNQESIIYIGHSMGTMISYILLSCKPEYNEKMKLVISLSPVAFWHAPSPPIVRFLKKNVESIKNFVLSARINEIFPLTENNKKLAKAACSDGSIFQQLCLSFVYFSFGHNPQQLNTSLLPFIFSYFPSGTSSKTLMHFSQNMLSGDFRMYDYGIIHNFVIYKQKEPPSYNLDNVVAPIALFYGKGDGIIAPGDVVELSMKLPNVVTIEAVPDNNFNHIDFVFSRDVKTLLNNRLLEIIEKYL